MIGEGASQICELFCNTFKFREGLIKSAGDQKCLLSKKGAELVDGSFSPYNIWARALALLQSL